MKDTLEAAALAAQLMDESGLARSAAVKKASRLLGSRMPSPVQLDEALESRHALCSPQQHRAVLREARQAAMAWMLRMPQWQPQLCGPAASGTSCPQDPVVLRLQAPSSKDVEFFLLSLGIGYRVTGEDPTGGETIELEDGDTGMAVILECGNHWKQFSARGTPLGIDALGACLAAMEAEIG